jgi:hypothetical protein
VEPEEYSATQAAITAAAVAYAASFAGFFLNPALTVAEWIKFLELIFPQVLQSRNESAALGRRFYDLQRDRYYPQAPNLARMLEPYEFKWFVQDMEPVRKQFSQPEAGQQMAEVFKLQVARAVENGGRKQIIHAVQADTILDELPAPNPSDYVTAERVNEQLVRNIIENTPAGKEYPPRDLEGRMVRGWARVATGRETCAWCLMLCSRGPVYESASTAGLKLPDTDMIDMVLGGEDVTPMMEEWHAGCDCKVVPVFNYKNWVGKEAAKKANQLYIRASKLAAAELEANPDKKYYSVKERRWLKTTENRETINQLRKLIDNGEIKSSDWTALAAA